MMPLSASGVAMSSVGATRHNRPNAATAPSIPENRLVARGLEAEWEQALASLHQAEAELARRERQRRQQQPVDRAALEASHGDLHRVWHSPATTVRDRKALLRTLIEEVILTVDRPSAAAVLTIRWHSGAVTSTTVALPRRAAPKIRTDDDTVDLLRRLAVHYPDEIIAGILNRQGRTTARGYRFTAHLVGNLRRYRKIPRRIAAEPATEAPLLNVRQAARQLGLAPSTVLRCLDAGFIPGEQVTPGAPWRIRLDDKLSSALPPPSRMASSPCAKPSAGSASRARPCCSVSSAASSPPSTSAKAAEKASISKPWNSSPGSSNSLHEQECSVSPYRRTSTGRRPPHR